MVNLKTVAAMSVVAVLSLVLLTSTTLPSMVAAQNNSENEVTERVAKYNQLRDELKLSFARILEEREKINDLEKQKEGVVDEQKKQELDQKIQASLDEIDKLERQMKQVEKQVIALFEVEPRLKERLEAVENKLIEKYVVEDSTTYVGDNPVEIVFVDLLRRQVAIIVNVEKVAPDRSNLPTENKVDGIPVHVEISSIETPACPSRTSECRPIIGGVSVAEKNTLSLNTAGYKAFRNGQLGFVIAGHTAGGEGKEIVQPHNDPSKRVGIVPSGAYCDVWSSTLRCDYAFVKADAGISVDNKIFWSSTGSFTITTKTPKSQQAVGTQVHKSGAASGVTNGIIWQHQSGFPYIHADLWSQNGDSGAPLFNYIGGPNASVSLYGMVFKNYDYLGTRMSIYFPWDTISNGIGAAPP